jgi:lipopolysaccharide export system permease protein
MGTFAVLVSIVGTMMLIRTLRQASNGAIGSQDLAMFLGYTMLGYLPITATLALFVSAVATLSRMYQDHEMDIWLSAGLGLSRFLKPLFRFAWPALLVIAAAAIWGWPWSNSQMAQMRERFEKRGDLERVTPGQFQESASGRRVFFLDKAIEGEDQTAQVGKNVFLLTTEPDREAITSAKQGKIAVLNGERTLILEAGQSVERNAAGQQVRVSTFEEYSNAIGQAFSATQSNLQPRNRSTAALWLEGTPAAMGQLSWRLGLVLAAFNLLIMSLAVASTNPRASRSANLIAALFAFIVYYNLITLGDARIASGKSEFLSYMLAVHGGALAISLAWLAKRHHGFSPLVQLKRWLNKGHASGTSGASS